MNDGNGATPRPAGLEQRVTTVESCLDEVKQKLQDLTGTDARLARLEAHMETAKENLSEIRKRQDGISKSLAQLVGCVSGGAKVAGMAINQWAVLFAAAVGGIAAALAAKFLM